ncbi:MAG: VOC family protein [Balneolales bacterium]
MQSMSTYAQKNSQNVQVKINHVAIAVTDLEESEEFYGEIIGLQQIPEPFGVGRHAWFSMGDGQLHVIKAADERVEHDISSHLCFSVADLDSFMENLSSFGKEFSDFAGNAGEVKLRPDGIRQIYFTDPDGYWVEVNDDF